MKITGQILQNLSLKLEYEELRFNSYLKKQNPEVATVL
jgi:hypothetical protein